MEDYAGLIEQLLAEANKRTATAHWLVHTKGAIALLNRAASALTTLTQDAKRYQWLRDKGGARYQVTASQPEGYKPCITMRVPSLNESGTYQLMGNAADSAIDAAMEGKADGR